MEYSRGYNNVKAIIRHLEQQSATIEQGQDLRAIRRDVEEHFKRCVHALEARRDTLFSQLDEITQRQEQLKQDTLKRIQESIQNCTEIMGSGSVIYKENTSTAENIWQAANDFELPNIGQELTQKTVEVTLPSDLLDYITGHGSVTVTDTPWHPSPSRSRTPPPSPSPSLPSTSPPCSTPAHPPPSLKSNGSAAPQTCERPLPDPAATSSPGSVIATFVVQGDRNSTSDRLHIKATQENDHFAFTPNPAKGSSDVFILLEGSKLIFESSTHHPDSKVSKFAQAFNLPCTPNKHALGHHDQILRLYF